MVAWRRLFRQPHEPRVLQVQPCGDAILRLTHPDPIRTGVSNRTPLTPIFPPAALRPSAQPFMRFGNEMLAMLEAKLPPPRTAAAVTISIGQNGVSVPVI